MNGLNIYHLNGLYIYHLNGFYCVAIWEAVLKIYFNTSAILIVDEWELWTSISKEVMLLEKMDLDSELGCGTLIWFLWICNFVFKRMRWKYVFPSYCDYHT